MQNSDIVKAHLRHKKWNFPENYTTYDLSYLSWYFVFDRSQMFYDKLKELPWKHEAKRIMKRIGEGFDEVDRNFWIGFNQEQTKFFIDKMNDFQDYIEHSVTLLKIGVMEAINHLDIETQGTLADIWMMFILAYEAQQHHLAKYRYSVKLGKGKGTKEGRVGIAALDKIVIWGEKLLHHYIDDKREVNQKRTQRVVDAASALSNVMFRWLAKDAENEAKRLIPDISKEDIERLKAHLTKDSIK